MPERTPYMVDWLVYLVGTTVVGSLVAFVIAMFKVGPGKPEFSFGKTLGACLLIVGALPFGYVEYLSRSKGPALRSAIHEWYRSDDAIEGKLVGQKVLAFTGSTATVLVIGQERSDWGGTDRPIIRLKLAKEGGKWKAEGAQVLRSFRLGKDEFIFPPYQ